MAGSGLACIVVKLHQAEDQVCGDQLKLIWWVGDDVSVEICGSIGGVSRQYLHIKLTHLKTGHLYLLIT